MSSDPITVKNKGIPYVRLGKSGLKVSRIILGCMSYGDPSWEGWVLPEEESLEHIKLGYDAGINTFDTANMYSFGESERILGKAIKKYNIPREEIVVLTKLCFSPARLDYGGDEEFKAANAGAHRPEMGRFPAESIGFVNRSSLSRKHIFHAVKESLERLQLDYIDVLQCHRLDSETPIEETMQALHDVVKAGYVRYIGMSSCFTWEYYAINNRLTPFISMQNHYSLLYREEEREMFPTLKHFGVGSIPWSPLARGLLTRPFNPEAAKESTRNSTDVWVDMLGYANSPATPGIIAAVEEIAKARGVSMAQIALAWILSKEGVTAPIVGTTSIAKLKDLIAGVHIKLTPEEIAALEKDYRPVGISGHWYYLGMAGAGVWLDGGTKDKLYVQLSFASIS